MSVFGVLRTFYTRGIIINTVYPLSRVLLRVSVAAGSLLIASLCAPAQDDTIGGTARPRRGTARIEATTDLRWNKAPFDSSNGTSTYWLHASVAGGGAASGGFTVDMRPRMLGKLTSLLIDANPTEKSKVTQYLRNGKPMVARMVGSSSYGEKTYRVQIDVVSDYYKPAANKGSKGTLVRGSIHVKMTDVASKKSFEGAGAQRSSVTIWLK